MAGGEYPSWGQNRPYSGLSDFTTGDFQIDQAIRRMNIATIAQVKKITTQGDVAAVGTMDVVPLVNMIDGANRVSKHGTVYSILYARMQGGTKSVILDPKVGDVGLVVFADRDTTNVRKSKQQSPPGSRRRNDMADGIWVMTLLGDKPTSYVQFKDDGTIICGVRTSADDENACELVVAKDHVQMKKHGSPSLHMTVDAVSNQLIVGMDFVVGPDPFPDD